MTHIHELLRRDPLFEALPNDDVGALAQAFVTTQRAAGTRILHRGERGDALHLVISGDVDVMRRFGGQDVVVRHVGAGEFLGLNSVLLDRPRTADAVVVSNAEVATISRSAVQLLLGHSAPITCAFQRALGRQLARDLRFSTARLRTLLSA